jgi:hypothetical protein
VRFDTKPAVPAAGGPHAKEEKQPMELDHAILADGVTQRPDGKIDIYGAGWDTIFAPWVPATHPQMALVLRLLVTPHELESQHSVLVVILTADGHELARMEARLHPMPPEQRQRVPAARRVGIAAVLNFVNVTFPSVWRLWDQNPLGRHGDPGYPAPRDADPGGAPDSRHHRVTTRSCSG